MSKYTASGLVEYAKKCLKMPTVYMWGGMMRMISVSNLAYMTEQYKNRYTQDRISYLETLIGKKYSCDCVGLVKSYYWDGIGSPNYSLETDLETEGMFNIASNKGTIDTLPEEPGIILWMKGHVGVYVGSGKCIECTWGSYGDGVVQTRVNGRGWTHWLKIPMIDYSEYDDDCKCSCDCKGCQDCECGRTYDYYTVEPGDSFWAIADKVLGNGARYGEICMLNGMTALSVIHPGDKLKVPKE